MKRIFWFTLFVIFLPRFAFGQRCDLDTAHPIILPKKAKDPKDTQKRVYRLTDHSAVVFFGRMTIDADGAPHAYTKTGEGLDDLSDGGHPGNWFGVATDAPDCGPSGIPIVQRAGDPAPGYFVSRTTMTSGENCRRQTTYVNSEAIPFVALPQSIGSAACQGPLVAVMKGQQIELALQADNAPASGVGEGSIALAASLGIRTDARHGGDDDRDLIYVVLEKRMGFPDSADEVRAHAGKAFESWGGQARAQACKAALEQLPK